MAAAATAAASSARDAVAVELRRLPFVAACRPLLVPMLAFDGDGYRIGWGGGFYDRTIATLKLQQPTLAIGVAYSGQRVDTVPRGDQDQPLDWVVTEEGSLEIGGAE